MQACGGKKVAVVMSSVMPQSKFIKSEEYHKNRSESGVSYQSKLGEVPACGGGGKQLPSISQAPVILQQVLGKQAEQIEMLVLKDKY